MRKSRKNSLSCSPKFRQITSKSLKLFGSSNCLSTICLSLSLHLLCLFPCPTPNPLSFGHAFSDRISKERELVEERCERRLEIFKKLVEKSARDSNCEGGEEAKVEVMFQETQACGTVSMFWLVCFHL